MDVRSQNPQHRGVHRPSRFEDTDSLPTLLAEYGRLAAELPTASPERAEWLHERLRTLDEVIDRHVLALGTTRL